MAYSIDQPSGLLLLLSNLDDAGIPYVSWKNNHELDLALAGKSDLDLFVPLSHMQEFRRICEAEQWVGAVNPVARVPWTLHLYRTDSDGNFYHVHVYFRVVTGESWLKEFVLPLDQLLLQSRVRVPGFQMWLVAAPVQAYLFAIRHLLKGASWSSRLLYRRELESYREEWRQCRIPLKVIAGMGPISLKDHLHISGLDSSPIEMPGAAAAFGFRSTASAYLRFPRWTLPPRRVASLLRRVAGKAIYRKKKLLNGRGAIIALTGVDGAGKTTMLAELGGVYSRIFCTVQVRLGRPQDAILEMIARFFRRGRVHDSGGPGHSGAKRATVAGALRSVVLAGLRLRTSRRSARIARRGYLVFSDRWPTSVPGKMDGPKVHVCADSGLLVKTLFRLERWLYSKIEMADLCVILTLPLEVALDRNRRREKDDKETDKEIEDRYVENCTFVPLAHTTVRFDNHGDLLTTRKELLDITWEYLSRQTLRGGVWSIDVEVATSGS